MNLCIFYGDDGSTGRRFYCPEAGVDTAKNPGWYWSNETPKQFDPLYLSPPYRTRFRAICAMILGTTLLNIRFAYHNIVGW